MLVHEWLAALAPGHIAALVAGTIACAGADGADVGICEPSGWISSLLLDCAEAARAVGDVPGTTVIGAWAGTGTVAGACIDPA